MCCGCIYRCGGGEKKGTGVEGVGIATPFAVVLPSLLVRVAAVLPIPLCMQATAAAEEHAP